MYNSAKQRIDESLNVGRRDRAVFAIFGCNQCAVRATTLFKRQDAVAPVPGKLRRPFPTVGRPLEHAEVLPVDCPAGRIVIDREIRRAPAAIRRDQRTFVLEIDLLREEKVRDDHLGLRADRDALPGLVDEASLEEPSINLDGSWRVEEVGEPRCGF